MRARWLVPVVAIVVAVGALVVVRARVDATSEVSSSTTVSGEPAGPAVLPARVVTAGAVDLVIEPIRIDATGAVFRVTMDTHSEELSADLATTSVLEVDGVDWTGASWSGDAPGGHHRAGELDFDASGPAADSAVLSIDGFAAPIEVRWELSG